MSNKPKLTSAKDLLPKSYDLVKKNLNLFAVLLALPAALAVAETAKYIADNHKFGWSWGQALNNGVLFSNSDNVGVSGYLAVALALASIVVATLGLIASVRVAQGKKPSVGEIVKEYTSDLLWIRFIGLEILLAIIMVIGFLLLVGPFIILMWRLYLAPIIFVDKKIGITESIAESWKMTSGFGWPIYSILIFQLILAISGLIPFAGAIAAFLLSSAYMVAGPLRYEEIKKAR